MNMNGRGTRSEVRFGKQLKEFRKHRDMTQRNIAEFLKMTPTAISDYESGRREPSLEIVVKIADHYGIRINWLLTGSGDMMIDRSETSKGDVASGDLKSIDKLIAIIESQQEVIARLLNKLG